MNPKGSLSHTLYQPLVLMMMLMNLWMIFSLSCLQVAKASDIEAREDGQLLIEENSLQHDLNSDLPEDEFFDFKDNDDDNSEIEYYDDLEDDYSENHRLSRVGRDVSSSDPDKMTEEDIQDLQEARILMESLRQEYDSKALIEVNPGTVTRLNPDDSYSFTSHTTFGIDRYPNSYKRIWYFCKTPRVTDIIVFCPFFRIEWSKRCKNDRFGVFKSPHYTRGIRRCGQIHGFWKSYTDQCIKIVFNTNASVRRAGFLCRVRTEALPPTTTTSTSSTSTSTSTTSTSTSTSTTSSTSTSSTSTSSTSTSTTTTTTFMPGCDEPPQVPAVRKHVTKCSDILPGYNPPCQCSAVLDGLCIVCSICTACDMEFFAVHDFSSVKLYIHFDYPCHHLINMTKSPLPYGFQNSVYGIIMCYPPPTYIIRPVFPQRPQIFFAYCPLTIAPCPLFSSFLGGRRSFSDDSYAITSNLIEGPYEVQERQSELPGFENLGCNSDNFHLMGIDGNLSTVCHPELKKYFHIEETTGVMFPLNFCSFSALETLLLKSQLTALPSGSIMICSSKLESIEIWLPNAMMQDIDPNAITCCAGCVYCNTLNSPPLSLLIKAKDGNIG